jgi:hypothetical protein
LKEPITILKTSVFVDPFKELDNEEEKKKKEEEKKKQDKEAVSSSAENLF